MIPVEQTGRNCVAAACCSLLDIPDIDQGPKLLEPELQGDDDSFAWWLRLNAWFRAHGRFMVVWERPEDRDLVLSITNDRNDLRLPVPRGYAVALGKDSVTGRGHAVVHLNGALSWDPRPNVNRDLEAVLYYVTAQPMIRLID